ncbi:hypothetical protein [Ruegeria arenilitoris]|uniref:hypothetical protein n=1 Tax=Ruegeria arenilitoris TaxID=1173585 RepID=UPI00147B4C84|nr:hypothetical protein [Ruegeria arenilitoris]
MLIATRRIVSKALVLSLALASFSATVANAITVTYGIEIDGAIGTFDAPDTGGLLTSFSITIDGVTFDTLGVGNAAPVYDATSNDIRGNPGTEGFITNSAAGSGCLAMECVLSLEDSTDPGVVPPLFAIFPLVGGMFPGGVTNSGEYAITMPPPMNPVPLPAPLTLLAAAILALFTQSLWGRFLPNKRRNRHLCEVG